jgi:ribonuclease HII
MANSFPESTKMELEGSMKFTIKIGVDEAGRGCCWGPVFAGAVILPQSLSGEKHKSINDTSETKTDIDIATDIDNTKTNLKSKSKSKRKKITDEELLRDSKKLSEKRREEAVEFIHEYALAWGIGSASSDEIDKVNILQADMMAMHRAIRNCIVMYRERFGQDSRFDEILIDGNYFKTYMDTTSDGETDIIPYSCIVKGDDTFREISAASILAKTARDHYVYEAIEKEPELHEKWGLGKHKGYCTKVHLDAIRLYGIHPEHRKSFGPVKNVIIANHSERLANFEKEEEEVEVEVEVEASASGTSRKSAGASTRKDEI